MKYLSTFGRYNTNLAESGAWILYWDMELVCVWRGSYDTTGITSKWWTEHIVITESCSRATEGSPRGIFYPPTIFNTLVDVAIIQLVVLVEYKEAVPDGFGRAVQWMAVFFYVDYSLLA